MRFIIPPSKAKRIINDFGTTPEFILTQLQEMANEKRNFENRQMEKLWRILEEPMPVDEQVKVDYR